jgi:hypothetical protein
MLRRVLVPVALALVGVLAVVVSASGKHDGKARSVRLRAAASSHSVAQQSALSVVSQPTDTTPTTGPLPMQASGSVPDAITNAVTGVLPPQYKLVRATHETGSGGTIDDLVYQTGDARLVSVTLSSLSTADQSLSQIASAQNLDATKNPDVYLGKVKMAEQSALVAIGNDRYAVVATGFRPGAMSHDAAIAALRTPAAAMISNDDLVTLAANVESAIAGTEGI